MPWGVGNPHPLALTLPLSPRPPLTPTWCLSRDSSPVSLPVSVLSPRAEPLASPPALPAKGVEARASPAGCGSWSGQDLCCLQPPIHPPSELTINLAPLVPAAVCLWGGKSGRAVVCTLAPSPLPLPSSQSGPAEVVGGPLHKATGYFVRRAPPAPHPILKRPERGRGLPEFTRGQSSLCSRVPGQVPRAEP